MSLTINTKTYNQGLQLASNNGFNFKGPNHSETSNEYVQLISTPATKSSTSNGKTKSNLRMVRGATDGTDILSYDMIANVQISVPVGVDSSELSNFIADLKDAVNSATLSALIEDQTVTG